MTLRTQLLSRKPQITPIILMGSILHQTAYRGRNEPSDF